MKDRVEFALRKICFSKFFEKLSILFGVKERIVRMALFPKRKMRDCLQLPELRNVEFLECFIYEILSDSDCAIEYYDNSKKKKKMTFNYT